VIGKCLVPSPSGGDVAYVAALQMVPPKSPEYTPASPSPPRHRVHEQKVGIGKVLSPPLDRKERESVESNPRSVRRTRSPPRIRGPPEIWAYMDSDEEEEGVEIKELREQLAALKLNIDNMDERVAESEIERMDLDDKVDTLRKAMCSKIKHLAKATGNEDLYRAPDPRD
jgi:hypothetical protein